MENVLRFVFTTLLLVWSSVAFSTGLWSIGATYFYTGRFTIESHHDVCEQPLNNRCVAHYEVRRPDGELDDFVPFIYQFDPSYLVEGWTFAKNRWGFSYEINGAQKPWPYLWSRVEWTLLGIGGLSVWYFVGGPGALKGWLRDFRRQVFSKA
ncbi:hypothetical protein [Dyella sp. SG609]|uniref:hypothetical protein n=1 Tax=Dyella sp. SG609 TaxID=2587018 RepID=UPI001445AA0D|nr:hypothetical protein [Dyella sp. SG609]NKJ23880.1 hypothetical protein [Dyella sp. SG609]